MLRRNIFQSLILLWICISRSGVQIPSPAFCFASELAIFTNILNAFPILSFSSGLFGADASCDCGFYL